MTNTNTFCLISISNLKTERFETRRFETWRFVNLTFCKPDVLKPDDLKSDWNLMFWNLTFCWCTIRTLVLKQIVSSVKWNRSAKLYASAVDPDSDLHGSESFFESWIRIRIRICIGVKGRIRIRIQIRIKVKWGKPKRVIYSFLSIGGTNSGKKWVVGSGSRSASNWEVGRKCTVHGDNYGLLDKNHFHNPSW
jgi:hypothetical protein